MPLYLLKNYVLPDLKAMLGFSTAVTAVADTVMTAEE